MKTEVLNKLTSSNNQRIAFSLIFDRTMGIGNTSALILNDEFKAKGLDTENANMTISRAHKGLIKKKLIFKRKETMHNYDFDVYRFQLNIEGIYTFLGSEK